MTLTVRQLAEWVNGELIGDGEVVIQAIRPLSEAGPGDLTFVEDERHLTQWHASGAAAAIVSPQVPVNGRPLIRVADPLKAFANLIIQVRGLNKAPSSPTIDPTSHIHPTARIGQGVTIAPFCVVGEGSVVGDRCRLSPGVNIGRNCVLGDDIVLHPHVVLYDDTQVGHRVIIHANTVIGADGFGYRVQNGKHVKVPQLGRVEIGDDVEIGACTTIDRGTFGPTRIGNGTKIDNLVMVAHNCQIGAHNLLVAQVGVAGSCSTGNYVVLAGQAGIGDHVKIGDGALLGPRSAVVKDVPAGSRYHGAPARPDKEALRIILSMDKLPDLIREVRQLKQAMASKDTE